VVGYQRFRGPCCLHIQSEVKWRRSQFGPLKRWYPITKLHWRWRQHGPLKRRYPTTTLHWSGGSMDLWNVGILPQYYTAWQARRLRLETVLNSNGRFYRGHIGVLLTTTSKPTLRFAQPPVVPPWSKLVGKGKLTNYLNVIPRLRMRGGTSLLSHTSSCRSVQLSTSKQSYMYFD
jgi:hypothetical protein